MPPAEDVRNGRKARPPHESGVWEAAQRFWRKSLAGEYVGLALLAGGYLLLKFFGHPFHQLFLLSDVRLQHPHAEEERVGVVYLFLSSVKGLPQRLMDLALFFFAHSQRFCIRIPFRYREAHSSKHLIFLRLLNLAQLGGRMSDECSDQELEGFQNNGLEVVCG